MKKTVLLFLFLVLFFDKALPQEMPDYFSGYTIVIPNENYRASSFYEFFFGEHWRKLWVSPVKVGILDLNKFAGGITPTKKGGGFQTKSLRFVNKEGVQYKFRSLNKDPKKVLPLELQETIAADIMQDQISSSNPFAALVVVPILTSVGILQAEPMLCILPNDDKLGEFKNEFGGLIGMIEIHPDVPEGDEVGFEGATKVESTFDLFEKLEKGNQNQVDSKGYLKARLTDMFLGDWDRHTDQWRWALIPKPDGKKYWEPIPRDRDQAFARYDGLFPFLFARAVTQIEHFDAEYNKVESLTWSGRYIDRRFLNRLSRKDWDSITAFIQESITDSVIRDGVSKLPEESFKIAGDKLTSDLIQRRDKLNEVSDEFYHLIMKYVDIHLTNEDDYLVVDRISDSAIAFNCYRIKKGIKDTLPYYTKTFLVDETKEIRVMMKDGDDVAIVKGNVDNSSLVIVAGDKGKDTFVDSSNVNGYLFGFLPIHKSEYQTEFFDGGNKSTFIKGSGTRVFKDTFEYPEAPEEKFEPKTRDWGHDWRLGTWLDVNPDDGILVGLGPILYKFGFRVHPYVYRAELIGARTYYTNKFKLRYQSRFYKIIPGIHLDFEFMVSGMEISNFYGFGNETFADKLLEEFDFYKARMLMYYIKPSTEINIYKNLNLLIGAEYKYTDPDEYANYADSTIYGFRDLNMLGVETGLKINTTDNDVFPQSGIYWDTRYRFSSGFNKKTNSFSKIKSDFRFYVPFNGTQYSLFAMKLSWEHNIGRYPFFESAFIGGSKMLRSFEKNRFAGDSYVLLNSELRLHVLKFEFIVPMDLGFTFGSDIGRVFYNNEKSKKWHSSFSTGMYIFPINKEYVISMDVSYSKIGTDFYLRTGFLF